LVEIYAKNGKLWVSEPNLGEVRGDARLWLIARLKAHGGHSIHIDCTFHYLLQFWSYEAKCVQLACFRRGSTSLHSNFTWTGLFPINHPWRQKTTDTGLLDGDDASFSIPSFWHNTGVWRTDRQTGRRICV